MSAIRPLAIGLACLAVGCSPSPPVVVPLEGTVTLDGAPLPCARVEFVPDLKQFGAEYGSTAVTDENGRFVLVCTLGKRPGAVVSTHKVLVTEYIPDELRATTPATQAKLAEYQARLKNRPIPDQYGSLARSPLTVEVKEAGTRDLKLTRGP